MAVLELKSFEMLQKPHRSEGKQCVLSFGNYELSIITGPGAYGTQNAPYEICVFKDGDQQELPGITAEGDTVKGYLTEADVDVIIKKMYFLTGKSPEQI